MIENLSEMDVYQRVLGVMQNIEWVSKTGEVSFGKTNYQYVTETRMLEDIRPWMVEYGLIMHPVSVVIQPSKDGLSRAVITYQIVAAGYQGENESMFVEVLAEGADSSDKGAYKTMTGAQKVALRQAFLIITGEPSDPEATDQQGNSTGNPDMEAPMEKALRMLTNAGVKNDPDVKSVLKEFNINLNSEKIDSQTVKQARSLSKFAKGIRSGENKNDLLENLRSALSA